jgi:hypothetical protein
MEKEFAKAVARLLNASKNLLHDRSSLTSDLDSPDWTYCFYCREGGWGGPQPHAKNCPHVELEAAVECLDELMKGAVCKDDI